MRKGRKKLFTSVRNFIDDKSRKHYLKLYRKQASYELQSLMKSTITSTANKMSKAFLPIFPTTTANILQIMQNFHHDAKEVIRKTKWHVPKLMKLLYDLIFKGCRDIYRHYATANLDHIPAAISAGESYTTVVMESGRVVTFGNQDDIQAGFRDEIMNNLPKKFRRLIEKQREKKVKAQTRELARRRSMSFQAVEGFTLPRRDSALHGLDIGEYKRQIELREGGVPEEGEDGNIDGPQSPVRHSPTRQKLLTQADHDIPAFFETHECHFNDDGHRTAGSIHARDSVHDAEGLMRLHAELSATPHHPNSDGSSDESHEAYSSDSSYSSSDVSTYTGSSSSSESSYTRDDDRSGSQSTTSTYVKSTS